VVKKAIGIASLHYSPRQRKLTCWHLLASCPHKKSDWYDRDLIVSPLDPGCAEYFRYTAAGEMFPTTDHKRSAAARTIIELIPHCANITYQLQQLLP
jgi:hypothetical protein